MSRREFLFKKAPMLTAGALALCLFPKFTLAAIRRDGKKEAVNEMVDELFGQLSPAIREYYGASVSNSRVRNFLSWLSANEPRLKSDMKAAFMADNLPLEGSVETVAYFIGLWLGAKYGQSKFPGTALYNFPKIMACGLDDSWVASAATKEHGVVFGVDVFSLFFIRLIEQDDGTAAIIDAINTGMHEFLHAIPSMSSKKIAFNEKEEFDALSELAVGIGISRWGLPIRKSNAYSAPSALRDPRDYLELEKMEHFETGSTLNEYLGTLVSPWLASHYDSAGAPIDIAQLRIKVVGEKGSYNTGFGAPSVREFALVDFANALSYDADAFKLWRSLFYLSSGIKDGRIERGLDNVFLGVYSRRNEIKKTGDEVGRDYTALLRVLVQELDKAYGSPPRAGAGWCIADNKKDARAV